MAASRPQAIVRQAGGIVVRDDGAAPQFLIVRARRNPAHWIFPKGHVERGETAEAAAIREVREEAGVTSTPIAPLGAVEYADGARQIRAEYFLLRHGRFVGADEARETRWCTLDEALALLTFDSTRDLLRAAPARLEHRAEGA